MISSNLTVTDFHWGLHNYISNSRARVMEALKNLESFRDYEERDVQIDTFLNMVKACIYVENISFDSGTDHEL